MTCDNDYDQFLKVEMVIVIVMGHGQKVANQRIYIFSCVIPKKMRNFVVSKQDYSP